MIAADTNILTRCLANDDPQQARLAADLLNGAEQVWLPKTVVNAGKRFGMSVKRLE
ncbi:MAG: type II toxin-antitoxin system VapC family toxin [Gammaproteobacteria bacterium]|nr:type II toxin-antitoxin system VapC family toxin [Gammaproteobacteria bacterium]